jgi:hypothetical protein
MVGSWPSYRKSRKKHKSAQPKNKKAKSVRHFNLWLLDIALKNSLYAFKKASGQKLDAFKFS